MPRGLERRHDTWDLHFITFRCYQRQPLLARYKAMALFEAALEKSRRRYDFFVVGYWRWSSFEHYATGKDGVVEIESMWTARKRERMGITLKALQDRTRHSPETPPWPTDGQNGAPDVD